MCIESIRNIKRRKTNGKERLWNSFLNEIETIRVGKEEEVGYEYESIIGEDSTRMQ